MMRGIRQPRTFSDRLRVIEEIENNPNEKKIHIAKRLGIAPSTLTTIYTNKSKIRKQAEKYGQMSSKRKTCKESKFKDLELILFSWYKQSVTEGNNITGIVICQKAREIAENIGINNFSASSGWISRFKERHGLVIKKHKKEKSTNDIEKYLFEGLPTMVQSYGLDEISSVEKSSCFFQGSTAAVKYENHTTSEVSCPSYSELFGNENVSNWFKELPHLLEGYDSKDIYSLHETGLFYYCLPNSVLILKDEFCHNGSRSKERVSVLLCTNWNGSDKLVPVIVGKSSKPRCFKNVKTLPITYHSNPKSWFTKDIFSLFLKNLDTEITAEKRNILLFLTDCEAHYTYEVLKNIKLVFYPLGYSKPFHPLGNVIKHFKVNYRKHLIKKVASSIISNRNVNQPAPKINILEAMHFIQEAWNEVKPLTIENCFKKCFPNLNSSGDIMEDDTICDFEEWRHIEVPPGLDFYSYVNVDDNLFANGIESQENSFSTIEEDKEKNCQSHIPTFSEASDAFEIVKSFLFSHSLTDQAVTNITTVENLLHSLNDKT